MEISTGKSLSRRTALRNMGAAVALPLVDPTDAASPQTVEGKVALVTGSGRNLGRLPVLVEISAVRQCSSWRDGARMSW